VDNPIKKKKCPLHKPLASQGKGKGKARERPVRKNFFLLLWSRRGEKRRKECRNIKGATLRTGKRFQKKTEEGQDVGQNQRDKKNSGKAPDYLGSLVREEKQKEKQKSRTVLTKTT